MYVLVHDLVYCLGEHIMSWCTSWYIALVNTSWRVSGARSDKYIYICLGERILVSVCMSWCMSDWKVLYVLVHVLESIICPGECMYVLVHVLESIICPGECMYVLVHVLESIICPGECMYVLVHDLV